MPLVYSLRFDFYGAAASGRFDLSAHLPKTRVRACQGLNFDDVGAVESRFRPFAGFAWNETPQ